MKDSWRICSGYPRKVCYCTTGSQGWRLLQLSLWGLPVPCTSARAPLSCAYISILCNAVCLLGFWYFVDKAESTTARRLASVGKYAQHGLKAACPLQREDTSNSDATLLSSGRRAEGFFTESLGACMFRQYRIFSAWTRWSIRVYALDAVATMGIFAMFVRNRGGLQSVDANMTRC